MSHDPFCLAPKCDYDSPDGDCFGYEDCWHRCECILISKVRADEREQAAQRIAALEPTQDYGFMRVWRDEAINAARGYSDGNEFTRAAARGGEQA